MLRASLGELAVLTAQTEQAERLILSAALERLAAIDGETGADDERLVLGRVVVRSWDVLLKG